MIPSRYFLYILLSCSINAKFLDAMEDNNATKQLATQLSNLSLQDKHAFSKILQQAGLLFPDSYITLRPIVFINNINALNNDWNKASQQVKDSSLGVQQTWNVWEKTIIGQETTNNQISLFAVIGGKDSNAIDKMANNFYVAVSTIKKYHAGEIATEFYKLSPEDKKRFQEILTQCNLLCSYPYEDLKYEYFKNSWGNAEKLVNESSLSVKQMWEIWQKGLLNKFDNIADFLSAANEAEIDEMTLKWLMASKIIKESLSSSKENHQEETSS